MNKSMIHTSRQILSGVKIKDDGRGMYHAWERWETRTICWSLHQNGMYHLEDL